MASPLIRLGLTLVVSAALVVAPSAGGWSLSPDPAPTFSLRLLAASADSGSIAAPGFTAAGQLAGTAVGDTETAFFFDGRRVIQIGDLGGGWSQSMAVNDAGHVTGLSQTSSGDRHAFRWSERDAIEDLGTLGGSSSEATAINDAGLITGSADIAGDQGRHAFVWSRRAGMVDLGTLGGSHSNGLAINARGHVAGSSLDSSGSSRVFWWSPRSGMVDIGMPSGSTASALYLNDADRIAGTITDGSGSQRAFTWTRHEGFRDLGTFGGTFAQVNGLLQSGVVIGFAAVPGDATFTAFSWSESRGLVALPTTSGSSSVPVRASRSGVIIGYEQSPSGAAAPILWPRRSNAVQIALGSLGGFNAFPEAINSRTEVVGWAQDDTQAQRAFYWAPGVGMRDLNSLVRSTTSTGPLLYGIDISDDGAIVAMAETGLVLLRPRGHGRR